MAFKGIEMGLALVLVTMLLGRATAQSSCTSTLTSMSPCLNYITGNSSNPSSSCCSQLSNVVQSSPQCLCSLLNGAGSTLGITINQTLALSLPGACNVKTPPINQCQSANGPTTSTSSTPPAISPAGSSNDTPAAADTPEAAVTPSASDVPSTGGSKTVPSTDDGNTSDGSSIKAPLNFVLFLIFVISCASSFTKF
ncbi:PREDICTED: non-specific lipid-transfer protein-like protein At2g13820 isoform X2 [Fragaria vesca subsp. vesca]|uniref:non-specific lipid-transfer protein-like protein At2g13820 isoform X2 n=1 Tax=Fragaria vesca subsp. vesca TaxID=101020 RepID=UPI0002C31919|nr:PREDICTED: non-specific lipid-transfer protein-like protein At2g13820 isoform X2 [Fragaria vesca subsp. vesca]